MCPLWAEGKLPGKMRVPRRWFQSLHRRQSSRWCVSRPSACCCRASCQSRCRLRPRRLSALGRPFLMRSSLRCSSGTGWELALRARRPRRWARAAAGCGSTLFCCAHLGHLLQGRRAASGPAKTPCPCLLAPTSSHSVFALCTSCLYFEPPSPPSPPRPLPRPIPIPRPALPPSAAAQRCRAALPG